MGGRGGSGGGGRQYSRKPNGADNAKDPLETRTPGRVYATINADEEINSISYYDKSGRRYKAINLLHSDGDINGPHTHEGYFHKENGTRHLTDDEKKLVAFVKKLWYNRHSK